MYIHIAKFDLLMWQHKAIFFEKIYIVFVFLYGHVCFSSYQRVMKVNEDPLIITLYLIISLSKHLSYSSEICITHSICTAFIK